MASNARYSASTLAAFKALSVSMPSTKPSAWSAACKASRADFACSMLASKFSAWACTASGKFSPDIKLRVVYWLDTNCLQFQGLVQALAACAQTKSPSFKFHALYCDVATQLRHSRFKAGQVNEKLIERVEGCPDVERVEHPQVHLECVARPEKTKS